MKNQLEILLELQRLDDAIRNTEARHKVIPQIILGSEETLRQERSDLEARKKSLHDATLRQRKLEKDLKEVAEQMEKKQARKFAVKTNDEYKALLKEIEFAQQESSKIEDEILALFDEIDGLERSIKEQNLRVQARERELIAEKAALEKEISENERMHEDLLRQRKSVCESLEQAYRDAYEKTRSQRQGSAVVIIKGDVCPGCNMFIPPQTINEVLQTGEIRNCPHCHRIMYCVLEEEIA